MEQWKDVIDYEDYYEVSNLGNIRNKVSGNLLKPFVNSRGYQHVDLYYNKCKRVPMHKLVMETFNPDGYFEGAEIDHIDENKQNNKLDNLRYVTHEENINKHYRVTNKPMIGISPTGEEFEFLVAQEFAREHDLDFRHVSSCLKGRLTQHKGWKFYYKSEGKPKRENHNGSKSGKTKKCIAVSPDGITYEFMNQGLFADEHNLSRRQVNACLNGRSGGHKGWKFYYKED